MRQRKLISIDPAAVMRAGAIRVVLSVQTPRRRRADVPRRQVLSKPNQKGIRDAANQ